MEVKREGEREWDKGRRRGFERERWCEEENRRKKMMNSEEEEGDIDEIFKVRGL